MINEINCFITLNIYDKILFINYHNKEYSVKTTHSELILLHMLIKKRLEGSEEFYLTDTYSLAIW